MLGLSSGGSEFKTSGWGIQGYLPGLQEYCAAYKGRVCLCNKTARTGWPTGSSCASGSAQFENCRQSVTPRATCEDWQFDVLVRNAWILLTTPLDLPPTLPAINHPVYNRSIRCLSSSFPNGLFPLSATPGNNIDRVKFPGRLPG